MDINEFKTGVQPEVEPLRIYDYEKVFGAVGATEKFPSYYILPSDRIGIIKNQGNVGACVACVISSLAEVLEKIEAEKDGRVLSDEDAEFSEGWAYGALRANNANYSGMFVSSALEYWRKLGMLPKKYFNFLEEMPDMRKKVDAFPELYKKAKRYIINSYVKISYADKQKRDLAVKEALYNRKYGLVAVSDSGFNESHCIMLIGWDDEKDKYIFKNSWGKTWNSDGLGEIGKNKINEIYLVTDEVLDLPFKDVSNKAWYYGDVKNVYLGNLMSGVSTTEFKPNNNITRAEVATLLGRIVDLINDRLANIVKILKNKENNKGIPYNSSVYLIQKTQKNKMTFIDVAESTWYYNGVKLAYEYGLINGKSKEFFEPEANITRAEIASLIVRISNLFIDKLNYILKLSGKSEIVCSNNDMPFKDVSIPDWFYADVKSIFNLGIMTGVKNNCFNPTAFITRAEVATIINRLCKYIDHNDYIALK